MKKFLFIIVLFFLTILPVYAEVTYNVKFIYDDKVQIVVAVENNTILPLDLPEKEGYIFDGWTLNGEIFDFNAPIVSDIELVAKWEEKVMAQSIQTEEIKSEYEKYQNNQTIEYIIIIGLVVIVGVIKYVLMPKMKGKKENINNKM